MTHQTGYGLWSLVIINIILFIFFALSFFKPRTKLDWRAFNAFAAFIVALFVEMYGFILIMIGFLLQWPTLLTLVMFPILVTVYVRLAKKEERAVEATFGEDYQRYRAQTPAFLPRLSSHRPIRAAPQ